MENQNDLISFCFNYINTTQGALTLFTILSSLTLLGYSSYNIYNINKENISLKEDNKNLKATIQSLIEHFEKEANLDKVKFKEILNKK